jgi:hypothetical protein
MQLCFSDIKFVVSAEIIVLAISELVHTDERTVTTTSTSLRITPGFTLACDCYQGFNLC